MRAAIAAALLLASGSARADSDEPPVKLGARIAIGLVADGGEKRTEMSLGLSLEHPVFRHARVVAEYEWMWMLGSEPDPTMPPAHTPPAHAADGQRLLVGLRQQFAEHRSSQIRFFADVELGAGAALLDDSFTGVRVEPTGFVGLRGAYSIDARRAASPSHHFDAELLLRLVATPEGGGTLFGVGMLWD